MHLIKLVVAALPALALADTTTTYTSTQTQTQTLVKTITLSQVHTVTSTWGTNSTTYASIPTGGTTSFTPLTTSTAPAATKGPENAAGVLDATKIAFAGVAGMLVAALM